MQLRAGYMQYSMGSNGAEGPEELSARPTSSSRFPPYLLVSLPGEKAECWYLLLVTQLKGMIHSKGTDKKLVNTGIQVSFSRRASGYVTIWRPSRSCIVVCFY